MLHLRTMMIWIFKRGISKNQNWLLFFQTSLDSSIAGPMLILLVSGIGPAGYFEEWYWLCITGKLLGYLVFLSWGI